MPGGRPRLPDKVKQLKGTERKCRVNKNAPQLPVKFPKPPRGSTKEERKIWRWLRAVIDPMQVTSEADVAALQLLARSMARWERALEETSGGREYYESVSGEGTVTIKAHPAVKVAMECERFVKTMLTEFGLTPASRSKVNSAGGQGDDPKAKILAFANRRKHASG